MGAAMVVLSSSAGQPLSYMIVCARHGARFQFRMLSLSLSISLFLYLYLSPHRIASLASSPQVYLFDGADGQPTTLKANDTISFNYIIANYHSSMAIDNDGESTAPIVGWPVAREGQIADASL